MHGSNKNHMLAFVLTGIALCLIFVMIFLVAPGSVDSDDVSKYYNLEDNNKSSKNGSKEKFFLQFLELQIENKNNDEKDEESILPEPEPNPAPNPAPSSKDWVELCLEVHNDWQAAGLTYGLGVSVDYDSDKDGKPDCRVRTDCSGYISYCLYEAGLLDDTRGVTSSSAESKFKNIKSIERVAWDSRQAGDICVYSQHMEIFYKDIDDSSWEVLNWGGPKSVATCPIKSSQKPEALLSIWRVLKIDDIAPPPPPVPTGNKIVFLDAGHGCTKYTKSANAHPYYGYAQPRSKIYNKYDTLEFYHDETVWTDMAVQKVKKELEAMGITVRLLSDYSVPEDKIGGSGTVKQATRDWIGNAGRRDIGTQLSDASIIIQFHTNAGGGKGIDIFNNKCASANAKAFLDNWDQSLSGIGIHQGELGDGGWAFTARNDKPSLLVEFGFGDTPSEAYILNYKTDNVIKAIAKAIYAAVE